jgi:hypothetical protein
MALNDTTGKRLSGSARWSALWGVGMLLIFVGERIVGSGAPGSRSFAVLLGLGMIIGSMVARILRARNAATDRQMAERLLLRLYGLGLLAVTLYFVQSDLPTLRGARPLEHSWPRLATALSALWPAVWIAAAWPIALCEMAYAQIAKAPRLETGRIKDAMFSGLGLAFALVFVFTVAYVSSERDKKFDLAYFRTSRPGEVVRKTIRTLDQPLEIAVFFPAASEVREEVDGYLGDLAKESGQLKITHYDFDIDPIKAKEYGVSSNGILAFVRGRRHELLGLPIQMESARSALRTLDKEVLQRLMLIVRQARSALFTQGHGERSWAPPINDTDKRAPIKALRELLIDQSYDLREFGAADGLMQEVPPDTTSVMIIGPQRPFLPDESAALNRYVDRGGHLLIALDPENKVDMHEVLGPLQLEYKAVSLANDQAFARRNHQDSDRANLVTSTFSAHPSVTTLQRMGGRAPVILPGAGWIDAKRGRPVEIQVDSPIKAHYATFEDKNGNFQADPGETRRAWEVTATSQKGLSRVFVIGDSDCFADEAIHVPGNELMTLDVVHWLMNDELYQGLVSSEVDLPISHTRKEDVVWFYSTIFLAPVLVLGIGYVTTKRVRRKRGPPASPASPASPHPEGAQS